MERTADSEWRAVGAANPTDATTRLPTMIGAASPQAPTLSSGEQTSLFIAPPLIVGEDELLAIVAAVDHGLELADAE